MICIRCEQGRIKKAIIRPMNKMIYICDECDTVWTSFDNINSSPYKLFEELMEEYGIHPPWTEVEVIEEIK